MSRKPALVSGEEIRTAETEVLRALCSGRLRGTAGEKARRLLGAYAFQDVIHQLIFDALKEIGTGQLDLIRQELPARLTRKGFPEVDFEEFLAPSGLSGAQALALAKKLLQWSKSEEPPETDAV